MKTTELLHAEIYPRIFEKADVVFPELRFVRRNGNWESPVKLDGSNPKRPRRDKTVLTAKVPFKLLEQGRISLSVWDYIAQRDGLTDNRAILQRLAELANYDLPALKRVDFSGLFASLKLKERMVADCENYFRNCYLHAPLESDVKAYLASRGYTAKMINDAPICYYESQDGLRQHLIEQGHTNEAIDQTGLFACLWGDTHKLIFVHRDKFFGTLGFAARDITQGSRLPRYLKQRGLTGLPPYFIEEVVHAKAHSVIVMEGYLDALTAQVNGIKNAIATTGGQGLTDEHTVALKRAKVREVTLCFDGDSAGHAMTLKSIEKLRAEGMAVYVCDLPESCDPHDVIIQQGVDAFQDCLRVAVPFAKWRAQTMIKDAILTTDIGRDRLIREAFEWDKKHPSAYEGDLFLKEIAAATGTNLDGLIQDRDRLAAKYREELFQANIKQFFQEGTNLEPDKALALLKDRSSELLATRKAEVKPYTFADFLAETRDRPEGLESGFQAIDNLLRIPQGAISIVASRPSHGKTTFMMSLLLNLIRLYQDETFVFVTYEESAQQIALKLLNNLAGIEFQGQRQLEALEAYLRSHKKPIADVEEAKSALQGFMDSKRLIILDKPGTISDLQTAIKRLHDRHGLGAVFVDYIQKIPGTETANTRQVEIQRTSGAILETAVETGLAIILGAQFTRPKDKTNSEGAGYFPVRLDNLRESGDIEQDANLVLGMFNVIFEHYWFQNKPCTQKRVPVEIGVLKNRNGPVNERIKLIHTRSLFRFDDVQPTDNVDELYKNAGVKNPNQKNKQHKSGIV